MVWLQCALDVLDGVAAVCTGCDGVCTGWLVHWLDYEQGFCFSNHSIVSKYLLVTMLQNVHGSLFSLVV